MEESPLVGTSWTAVEIAFDGEPTAPRLSPISLDHPITLAFDSERTYGSTGCNSYSGALRQLSGNSFGTGNFRLTRKYCRSVMDQERNYLRFLRNRMFHFKIISTGEGEDELVLLDNVAKPDVEIVQGEEVLARFRVLNEDVE